MKSSSRLWKELYQIVIPLASCFLVLFTYKKSIFTWTISLEFIPSVSPPPLSLSHTHTHTHTHMQDLILWLWALWLHKAETQHKLFSTSKNSFVHVNRMSKNRFTGMDGPRVSSKKTLIRVQSQFPCPFLYSCTGICLHGGRMASSTFWPYALLA